MTELMVPNRVYVMTLKSAAISVFNQMNRTLGDGRSLSNAERVDVIENGLHDFGQWLMDFNSIEVVTVPAIRVEPSRDLRNSVFERDGFKCLRCGSQENLHADHVLPVAHGGETTMENLQTLCSSCNLNKSTDAVRYVS